jgi:hypothetical protein
MQPRTFSHELRQGFHVTWCAIAKDKKYQPPMHAPVNLTLMTDPTPREGSAVDDNIGYQRRAEIYAEVSVKARKMQRMQRKACTLHLIKPVSPDVGVSSGYLVKEIFNTCLTAAPTRYY